MLAQTPPLGGTVSHFRILEYLGRGGMGLVVKALDLRLERPVALKFLTASGADDHARRRFLNEARAASALDHPNICTVYEVGETEAGDLFLAMALCDGGTLKGRLHDGPLPLATAVDLALQIGDGLGAAHERGIVHRDVKPSNLMLTTAGRVKIVDFGIARFADQTRLTRAGSALGTTAYMSPEQLRAEEADPRADLWSLGVVLYEMLAGKRPFAGSEREQVEAILRRDPPPLSAFRAEVPPELERIVGRLLAKRAALRHGTATELRADLVRLLPAAAAEAPPPHDAEETLLEVPHTSVALPTGAAPGESGSQRAAGEGAPTVAHYRIVAPLGSGGMGIVYQAEDTRLERSVALKFLPPELVRDPEAKERFLQEARTASALEHPNLCTIYEVGETASGQLYLAMPCYEGETLAARLARGPLPVTEALDLACQAARGLAKAHRRGIVHRDIKPANLMVTADGILKILDFGIARLLGETRARISSSAGTPSYMSPEQVRGEEVGPATDLWSLGVVLYEMLAGRRPFRGGHEQSVFYAVLEEEPEPLAQLRPEVSEEQARVVARLLAKRATERYPSATAALEELEALRTGPTAPTATLPVQSAPVPVAAAATRQPGRAWWVAGLAAALLAAAALLLWWRSGRERVEQPLQATFTRLTDQEGRESFPSLSPDGSLFLYVKSIAGRSHLFLQQVGGSNPIDLSRDTPADDTQPAFSPDGRQIAFHSERQGGGLFVMGAKGESVRRLAGLGWNPSWSPDGRTIVYAGEGVSDPLRRLTRSQLWRVDVATGRSQPLATPGDAVQPSWSPHGQRIAFWGVLKEGGRRVIWTLPAAGGETVPVIRDDHLNWNPVWAPDGRHLYFSSDRGGSMNLWRVPIDEATGRVLGEPSPLTTPAQWSGLLSLSRDGRRIAYATDDGRSNVERATFDPVAARVTGALQPLTEGSRRVRSASPSPDGKWLVFDTSAPQEDLFVVNTAGGAVRPLTDDPAKDRYPNWSPDGRRIVFFSDRSGRYEAWTIRPDGSGLQQETATRGAPVYIPLWSPDGGRLSCLLGFDTAAIVDLGRPLAERLPRPLPGPSFTPRAWSPDGRCLAGSDAAFGLALYWLDGGRHEGLSRRGEYPVWLSDNRTLLYLDDGKVFALDRRTKAAHEAAVPPPSSSFLRVSVSPDDRTLYLVRAVEEGDVWVVNLR